MTRLAINPRKIALIAASGSFLLSLSPALRADEPAPPAPPVSVADRGARLNIAPLRVEFDRTRQGATVMLTNTSERELPVQARLFAWNQDGGEDRFAPSNALTISPAIIAIPPGQTQIVRLLRTGTPSPGEKRFRLAVDQLPDPTLARSGEAEARLRFTLPVFLDRDQAAPAQLSWRILQDRVELTNSGGATARILAIELKNTGGQIIPVERNSLRYIQGGSTISWPLANGCAVGSVAITAQIDGETASAQASPNCG